MEHLIIKGDYQLPTVNFYTNGFLTLSGRSIPVNAKLFYKKLHTFISHLNVSELNLSIDLSHINSESVKQLYNLISFVDKNKQFETININWHFDYDDEELLGLGKTIQEFTRRSNFHFLETIC